MDKVLNSKARCRICMLKKTDMLDMVEAGIIDPKKL